MERLLVGLLADGDMLMEGAPGLPGTLTARTPLDSGGKVRVRDADPYGGSSATSGGQPAARTSTAYRNSPRRLRLRRVTREAIFRCTLPGCAD